MVESTPETRDLLWERRIKVKFPNSVRIALGPAEDAQELSFSDLDTFSIAPGYQQNLNSHCVRLSHTRDGDENPRSTSCYLFLKEGMVGFFKEAIDRFEIIAVSPHPLPVDSERAAIHGLFESAVAGIEIVGPDFLVVAER